MELKYAQIVDMTEDTYKREAEIRVRLVKELIEEVPEQYRKQLLEDLINHLQNNSARQ